MKTIKQIADEIGVSKQAVQKRISRDPLYTSIQMYISTKQGTKHIDEIGENLIKSAFKKNMSIDVADNAHIDVANSQQPNVHTLSTDKITEQQPLLNQLNTENSFLRQRVEALEMEISKEREHSREQADKLSDLAGQLAELSRNNQILLGAEQSRTNPALLTGGKLPEQGEEKSKKKGVFGFFKK